MQQVQLGNDGALELPKGGGGIAICESTRMDEIPMNLGCIPGSADIVQHLVPADKVLLHEVNSWNNARPDLY